MSTLSDFEKVERAIVEVTRLRKKAAQAIECGPRYGVPIEKSIVLNWAAAELDAWIDERQHDPATIVKLLWGQARIVGMEWFGNEDEPLIKAIRNACWQAYFMVSNCLQEFCGEGGGLRGNESNCKGTNRNGSACRNGTRPGLSYCWQHLKQDNDYSAKIALAREIWG